jgi:diguanylate cyclase (GGDEF)-like protein
MGLIFAIVAGVLGLAWTAEAHPLRLNDADSYDASAEAQLFAAKPDEELDDYERLRAAGRFGEPAPNPSRQLARGGDIWVIFQVENGPESPRRDWVIWAPHAAQWLDARIAVQGQDAQILRSGFFVPPQDRPLQAIGYAFPLRLEPGQGAEIVLRGYLPPREDHRLLVVSAPRFRFSNLFATLLVFGVMGAALALGSYNTVMFVVLRERTYGYYALYALSSVFLWGTTHSVVTLFTRDGRAALTLNGVAVLMTAFAAMRFTHEFLELKKTARVFHVIIQGLSVAFIGLLVALFVLPQPEFKRLASIVGVPTMAAVVIAPIYLLARGYRRARFMVIGWAPLMLFPIIIGLRSLGVVRATWMSTELVLAFHGFEIISMALALGDRWRELDAARRRAQDDALEQLQLRLAQSEELAQAQIASQAAQLEAEHERLKGSLDALTGLRNRRAFDSEIPRVNADWGTDPKSDALLCVIDVDGLKRVNDDLGHAEGDRLLVLFGEHLSQSLRGMDRVYRLGGDEFAVFARAPNETARKAIEKRIRDAARQLQEEFPQADASLGMARLSETEGNLDEAYRLADERMYREKRSHHASRNDEVTSTPREPA